MKNIFTLPVASLFDAVCEINANLVKDKSDDYLVNSDFWTVEEHIATNACISLDDCYNLGLDTVIFKTEDGVSTCYACSMRAAPQLGEDFKLVFSPKVQELLFLASDGL